MAGSSTDHHHPVALLGNRNFVLLWCAYGVSAVGDHLSEMAILKTQDALNANVDITPMAARMSFLFFVPFFVLAPVTGLLADRFPRRGLMILADACRSIIMLLFALLIAWMGEWGTWGPFLPLLLIGMFAALFSPARSALLPTLIRSDQLIRANGLISGLGFIATTAAMVLGGHLANHYDPVVSFRLDAATFLASAGLLTLLRPPRIHADDSTRGQRPAPMRELIAGFGYVAAHRHVRELLVIAAIIWFCGPLVNSVIPAVVRDVYGGTYATMSAYRALLMLGLILGAILISLLGNALRSELAITWGLLGIGCGIALFATSVYLPFDAGMLARIGAVGVVTSGVFAVAVMASFNALLQRTVPDRFRGRVFGVKDVCTSAALLSATGLLGVPQWARVDRWVGLILFAVAAITIAAGLISLTVRLRRNRVDMGYATLWSLTELVAKFWWRFRRIGPSSVPREGAVIVAANHIGSADPLFLCVATPHRALSFMIAAEYMKWPVVGLFARTAKCIPVRRGTRETGAIRQAIRRLEAGDALGIFIDGGIVRPGDVARPKDGVAVLALKTGAPVIPAFISGTRSHPGIVRGLLGRHHARVRLGHPVDLDEFAGGKPDRATIRRATKKICTAIDALAPEEEDVIPTGQVAPTARETSELSV